MTVLQTILFFFPFASWIYLAFFHGRDFFSKQPFFWTNKVVFNEKFYINIKKNLKKKETVDICIIIPARNEEKTIENTLKSIVAQNLSMFDILIINDNSTDKTVQIAEKTFEDLNFKRFKIINGKKLPPIWSGKVWALKQGIDSAIKKNYKFFLFIDSDIVLKNNIIYNVKNCLIQNNFMMISLMAKLNCQTFWEKILIPAFIFFFQKLYPFNAVNNKNFKTAAAAGGFVFCKAKAFHKQNLFEKIKDKVIDDCNLARLLKKNGSLWLGLTNDVVSKRKYFKLAEIWKMVSRTAFEQLNYSFILVVFSVVSLFFLYLTPFLNLFLLDITKNNLHIINAITILLIIVTSIPTIKFYKLNVLYYFSLPISATFYMFMIVSSAYNHLAKKGNPWKGRNY